MKGKGFGHLGLFLALVLVFSAGYFAYERVKESENNSVETREQSETGDAEQKPEKELLALQLLETLKMVRTPKQY